MSDHRGTMPRTRLSALAAALVLASALSVAPLAALAQDAAAPAAPAAQPAPEVTPDTVVATVGGEAITEADISFAAEDLQQQLQQMAPEDRKAFLLTVLIDTKVMAKAAREQQLDQTAAFKHRQQYLEQQSLRRAYFTDKIATAVTPEAVLAAYDKIVKDFVPEDTVHARHILLTTEEDAKAIKAELDAGADFATLAKEKSTDPSAKQNGGDLGFFVKAQMVQPFAEAAFAMEPGQISEPVQSQFGWHIIKVEEKGKSSPPPLQQVESQLRQQLIVEAYDAAMKTLKEGVAVDIPDTALADAVKRQNEGQAAQ